MIRFGGDNQIKSLEIGAEGLALTKQVPFFVRELVEVAPNIKIYLNTSHESILREDLKKNGINSDLLYFESPKTDLHCKLSYENSLILSSKEKAIFPIDPLKFEKRKLLSEDEIKTLREKYKIRKDEKVVLGGSFHEKDILFLKDVIFETLKKDQKLKYFLVPRNQIETNSMILPFESDPSIGENRIFVIEEEGILDDLYSVCDIALLGNTFGRSYQDGQNPLEPAFYGKRILSGCSYRDYNLEAFNGLEKSGLLKIISTKQDILEEILRTPSQRKTKTAQENAKKFIQSKQGSARAYATIAKKILYHDLSYEEEDFLCFRQSYQNVREKFS